MNQMSLSLIVSQIVQGNNEDELRNDIQNLEDTPNETDDAETDYGIDSILSDIFWIYLQWCVIEMLRLYISTIEMRSLCTEIKCIEIAARLLNKDCVNKRGLDLSKEVL